MLETLDFSIRIGSTPTFLYFDLYLNSVLETRVGVLGESGRIFWIFATRNNDSEILVLSVKFLESYKSDVRYTTILTCSPSYLIRELLSHDYLHGVILTTVIYRYPSKIPVIDPNHENIAQNVHELNCEEPVCIDVVAVVSVSSHVITIRLTVWLPTAIRKSFLNIHTCLLITIMVFVHVYRCQIQTLKSDIFGTVCVVLASIVYFKLFYFSQTQIPPTQTFGTSRKYMTIVFGEFWTALGFSV